MNSVSLRKAELNIIKEDSLKKRYGYKLLTNLVGLPMSLIAQAIIPRGLGLQAYGDFNFLTNFFKQFVDFFDMGTSFGFYTKLSQRLKEFGLVVFYSHYIGLVSLITLFFVFIAHVTHIYFKIWPGQNLAFIYLAAFLSILSWVVLVINSMTDAYGVTVSSEVAKIVQKSFGTIILLVFFMFKYLNLGVFFVYNYLIQFFLGMMLIWIIHRHGYHIFANLKLPLKRLKEYCVEFYQYGHPLFIYAVAALITGIFDRWLLQFYGGSVQQGFYGLSYQIGYICFIFTSAMTPLLLREYSIAFGNKDLKHMAQLFRRYVPLFYSLVAFFACFIAVQAKNVIYIFGGNEYKYAIAAVTIMAFYPIHLTYGQLSNSVFFATNQTALYRNIGVTYMLIGLPVTYFLIAPASGMGLNLGATGLAVKTVLLQIFAVNVQLYFNAKLLKLSFLKYLGHQIICVVCLLALALLATLGTGLILSRHAGNSVIDFLLSGVIYTLLTIVFGYYIPIIFGVRRKDVFGMIKLVYENTLSVLRPNK